MKMIPGAKAASTRTGRSNPKNARLLLTFGPCLDRFSHFFQSTPHDFVTTGHGTADLLLEEGRRSGHIDPMSETIVSSSIP